MYESTYAELKSLPREQKVEALKELMATHSSQKKIAEKLGVIRRTSTAWYQDI